MSLDQLVVGLLQKYGLPVCPLPPAIFEGLKPKMRGELNPFTVRRLLANVTLRISDATADIDTHIQLIKYIIKNSTDMVALAGLSLLPLAHRPECAMLELAEPKPKEWIYVATEVEQQLLTNTNIVHSSAAHIANLILDRAGTCLAKVIVDRKTKG